MRRFARITVAALGALAAATLVAPSAAASPDYIGVSHDGITWELTTLAVPLDTDIAFMIPGDTNSAYMYLRNNSPDPAVATVSVRWEHQFAFDENLVIPESFLDGGPIQAVHLNPGDTTRIEVQLTIPEDYAHRLMNEVLWAYIYVQKEGLYFIDIPVAVCVPEAGGQIGVTWEGGSESLTLTHWVGEGERTPVTPAVSPFMVQAVSGATHWFQFSGIEDGIIVTGPPVSCVADDYYYTGPQPPDLPVTGADLAPLLFIAGGLLVFGLLILVGRRRRDPQASATHTPAETEGQIDRKDTP